MFKNRRGSYGEVVTAFIIFLFVAALTYNSIKTSSLTLNAPQLSINLSNSSIMLDVKTVSEHNAASDCWSIINDSVYDITNYISLHPGGKQTIMSACGIDSTAIFNNKGGANPKGHSENAKNILTEYLLGKLGFSVVAISDSSSESGKIYLPIDMQKKLDLYPNNTIQSYFTVINYKGKLYTIKYENGRVSVINGDISKLPTSTTTSDCINKSILKIHNKQPDCWVDVNGKVYDVTDLIPTHSGGTAVIVSSCGTDATVVFETKNGGGVHSSGARSRLNDFKIGDYCAGGTSVPVVTLPVENTTTPNRDIQITAIITSPSSNQVLSVGTTSSALEVTTNISGVCHWSTSNLAYSNMANVMSSTTGTIHTDVITSLTNGANPTVYVKCQNSSTNEGSAQVTFSVANAPAIVANISSPITNSVFPSGTKSVSIGVDTNVLASCSWSFSDVAYSSMNPITTNPATSHTGIVNGLSDGISKSIYVRCSDIYGNIMSSSVHTDITVVNPTDVQPVINISVTGITSPNANQIFNYGTSSVILNVNTNIIGTCKYNIGSDTGYSNMNGIMSTSGGISHTATIGSLNDGITRTLYVRCQNSSTNVMAVSSSVTFSISIMPQIIVNITSPSASYIFPYGTQSVTLSATTNITGTCKWSTSSSQLYSSMASFSTTGGKSHSTSVGSLTNGANPTVYVKCQNSSTNEGSAQVTFSVVASNQITLNAVELAKHNSASNCWLLISNKIYNATSYIYPVQLHPGQNKLNSKCGSTTNNFFGIGDHKNNRKQGSGSIYSGQNATQILAQFYLGDYGTTITWP